MITDNVREDLTRIVEVQLARYLSDQEMFKHL
jgi:hypothetical protein